MPKSPELYSVYYSMLKRCYYAKSPAFHRYGGRGVTVCERWRIGIPKGEGFRNFKSDLGPRPIGHTLERIDNNGNYEPSNCKWVSRFMQARNRVSNQWITYDGRTMIAKDWAIETGVREDRIMKRIRSGIPLEIALFVVRLPRTVPPSVISAAAKKKLAQTRCKRGHPFNGENLHTHVSKNGLTVRVCKTCKREAMRAYRGG